MAFLMAILSMLNAPQPALTPRTVPQRASRGVVRSSPPGRPAAAPVVRAPGPCSGWRPLVASYDWDADHACRILMCESRGDPNARDGRYHGLMQVGGGSFDPEQNIAQAHAMWVKRGWSPWECR